MIELISVHIPKTAGTAFRHVLIDVYGSEGVFPDYPPNKIHNPKDPIANQFKVIHGHFKADKYNNYFQNAKTITWLRHPIFRLISEYFFAKTINDKNNVAHAKMLEDNLGILDFASLNPMKNHVDQWLNGLALHEFDFIGIQEFYLDDLNDLKAMMGWKDFKVDIKNINPNPEYQKCLKDILNNVNLMNDLVNINSKDMSLYYEALNLRAERRKESTWVQSTLADWNRSQFFVNDMQKKLNTIQKELDQAKYWLRSNSQKVEFVEVVNFREFELADSLLGCYIDSPKSPIQVNENSSAITIRGWVIGKSSLAVAVRATCQGQILSEEPVHLPRPDVAEALNVPEIQDSGFQITVNILGISSSFEVVVEAILENKNMVTIGIIRSLNSADS